jgi:exodeoxyribonuclease-3
MKLISWNVNGIRAIAKKGFFESVSSLNPDILCLQETKAQGQEVEQTLEKLSKYHLYSNSADQKGYSGTAILSKQEPIAVTVDMGIAEHDKEGRKGYLCGISQILCGDFNVAHRPIDLKNDKANYNKTAGYTQIEIDGMDNMAKIGFVDTFRKLHPSEIAYSYWSYRFKSGERNVGWRIDYALVSESLTEKVNNSNMLPDYDGSDHCPIQLSLEV